MLIDLHTHTRPLSHDSLLTADELVEAAKTAGLDGLCLTEHDFAWDPQELRELAQRHRFLILPGIEVNTENGHILVFGLHRYVFGMHRVSHLAQLVEEAGGVMVAAHPYRRQLPFELEESGDWSQALERAIANPAYRHICALETHNGRGTERENRFSQELCQRLGFPATAGSDAHEPADVGGCATEFQRPIADLADLIRELRAGRFRPALLR